MRPLFALCWLRIGYTETTLRERIKNAGGIWRPRRRLYEIDGKTVRELRLQGRVVTEETFYT